MKHAIRILCSGILALLFAVPLLAGQKKRKACFMDISYGLLQR